MLQLTDESIVSTMCGVQLKDKKFYRFDVHVGFE